MKKKALLKKIEELEIYLPIEAVTKGPRNGLYKYADRWRLLKEWIEKQK